MPSSRIEERFRETASGGGVSLLPYFTAGFPDVDAGVELICRADALGVPVVEIGFPYSDSIADGPVIQSSFHHVLQRGHRLADAFELAARARDRVGCGLVAMVSFTLVHRRGVDRFLAEAADHGYDGVIVPDLPLEESAALNQRARKLGLCSVGLVAPSTSPERREEIAAAASGFVYQIAHAGTTGERAALPPELPEQVEHLRAASGLPVCVGFGISRPEHVRAVCRFADGAIVGSAIVRRIADAIGTGASRPEIVESVSRFVEALSDGVSEGEPPAC